MSGAMSISELEQILEQEVADFNKAVEAYARDQSVPHECVFTELSRRMNIIRNASQCTNVYNGWKNLAVLVKTWSDRDMWDLCVKQELSEKQSSASSTTGSSSNGMFTFQLIG
jgi:hypothetical protein